MTNQDVISKSDELEDTLITTAGLDSDITTELLDEYAIHVWALKSADSDYPLEQAIRIQEICEEVESKLPRVRPTVFGQYVIYLNLLAICLEKITKRREMS